MLYAAFTLALAMIEIRVRRRISLETWEQVKTAYAAGIGLREIARNMNLSPGTVLSRAKRQGWTRQIEQAMAVVPCDMQSDAIVLSPVQQSAAVVMQQRRERYRERMADVSEKVAGHLESMGGDEILSRSSQVERIDTVARRTFGLDNAEKGTGALNLAVLSGGRAIVQVAPRSSE